MEIAQLPVERIEQLVRLWEQAGLTRPWNDPFADARRALDTDSSTILAVLGDERVVASVMAGHDGHRGWMYYLAVEPGAQRRGLGRAMVQAATRWLGERGVPKVQLMVRSENAAVLAFYEALGFERQHVAVLGKRL